MLIAVEEAAAADAMLDIDVPAVDDAVDGIDMDMSIAMEDVILADDNGGLGNRRQSG
jgi:hypothetical protein